MGEQQRGRPVFVVHLMKTGGSSLLFQILANVPRAAVFGIPATEDDGDVYDRIDRYGNVEALRDLSPERADSYDVFVGHLPFAAVDLVPVPDLLVTTVVREPVARTVSYLRQCERDHEEHRGRRLEEIYDDDHVRRRMLVDHQTKMLGMPLEVALARQPVAAPVPEIVAALQEEGYFRSARFVADLFDNAVTRDVPVDRSTLAAAKANLERTDVLGLHEDYDAYLGRLAERLGWRIELGVRANVSRPSAISASFRRRIEADCALDVELYDHARTLVLAGARG